MIEHSRVVVLGVSNRRQAGFDHSQRAIDHRLTYPGANRHLAQLCLDRAKRRNGFAKLLPLVCITHRLCIHHFHTAGAHGAKFESANVENIESDLVSFADFTEQILDRRLRISQNQRSRARSPNAHLVFFRAILAPFLAFNDERGELVAVNFREHDEDVRETAVGDEHLFAVEKVMRAIIAEFRSCFRIHGV